MARTLKGEETPYTLLFLVASTHTQGASEAGEGSGFYLYHHALAKAWLTDCEYAKHPSSAWQTQDPC